MNTLTYSALNQNNMSGIIGGVKANRGIDLDNP